MEKLRFYFDQETGNCEIEINSKWWNEANIFFDKDLNPLSTIRRKDFVNYLFSPKNEPKYWLNININGIVELFKIDKIDYVLNSIEYEIIENRELSYFRAIYEKYHEIEVNRMKGYVVEESEVSVGENVTFEDIIKIYAKMHFKNC